MTGKAGQLIGLLHGNIGNYPQMMIHFSTALEVVSNLSKIFFAFHFLLQQYLFKEQYNTYYYYSTFIYKY